MKMGKFEKIFVNSKRHAKGNIRVIERLFSCLELKGIENVLEIGCGIGMLSDYLSKNYEMNVVGTDIDAEQIEIGEKYFKDNDKLSFSVESATSLAFGNSVFDMILSFKVLHHIDDWKTVLKEVNRVLKPEGIFVFSDFCYTPFMKKILQPFAKNYGLYTINDILAYLSGIDFKVIHQRQAMPFFFASHDILFQKSSVAWGSASA